MKTWLIGALAIAMVSTAIPNLAEAKRFGGGGASGMQRNMPQRTAPNAPPPRPANTSPQQAAPTAAGAPAAAGAAAAAGKRSWMGPIAGLAAGLGLVALMSHLGMGEAFANFLMLALLAVAGVALVLFLMRRFGGGRNPAMAGAAGASGGNANATSARVAWPQQPTPAQAGNFGGAAPDPVMPRSAFDRGTQAAPPASFEPTGSAADDTPTQPVVAKAFVPAAFDSDGFARTAKMIFIRMQTANDTADLEDLRRFTTPELFAAVRLEIQERGAAVQHTDVQQVDAEVLDVADEDGRQVVSVRFSGLVVEAQGAAPTPFNEVWHLVKPLDDSRPWAIAGIEQMQ